MGLIHWFATPLPDRTLCLGSKSPNQPNALDRDPAASDVIGDANLRLADAAVQDTRVDIPETRYGWNGDASLAYQIVGAGPIDIVSNLVRVPSRHELASAHLSRFLRGLGRHGRLTISDRRGFGLSERYAPADVPPLEVTEDDLIGYRILVCRPSLRSGRDELTRPAVYRRGRG